MSSADKPVSVRDLAEYKRAGRKIVALTAYDALFARLLDEAGVDVVLVGDSVNTVLAGQETTLSATLDQMVYHGRMVKTGIKHALVVLDMPFLTYQISVEEAKRNAGRAVQLTGAHAVKLEGGHTIAETVRAVVDMGVPVMGHIGYTPQSVHALGGARVQGRGDNARERMMADARALEGAGAFAIVLELMPADVAAQVSTAVAIPTIGIGSGAGCDGQVLVLHDMLGLNERFHAKFVKRYADLSERVRVAVRQYADEVRSGTYPDSAHSFEQ
jgi:3-methyl-2-oxobutanoate hydroxymethyltransferase